VLRKVNLGIYTVDGERVGLQLTGDVLLLSFVDHRGQPQRLELHEVLAFRWQELDDDAATPDDVAYEVVGSPWLARQCALQGERPDRYAHYMVCFNVVGVLDVVCRRREGA
jgi:hypothetical protein